ncbi:hypothetical protein F2Q70_00041704 [Brassica cretica]|uniref:Uncharacterized protein n=1 Tax=Brassica cretica TaxID=69181 RepID=A0A8S9KA55_BRACR|nr:hypothetical protein F2Q70_00041704 [Brassica cretica]
MAKPLGTTGEFFRRRDEWRKHPMLSNQMRHALPGLLRLPRRRADLQQSFGSFQIVSPQSETAGSVSLNSIDLLRSRKNESVDD